MNRPNGSELAQTHTRHEVDRRRRVWWSVCYGNFNPRRRAPPRRRLDRARLYFLDWHGAHLLAVSVAGVILSAADAFLTMLLLNAGADEVNPIMAALMYKSVAVFAALKMGMTGISIVVMVFLARYRFMRLLRVEWVLCAILLAYASLICYEVTLLKSQTQLPIF
jgi:hypothetical protein